MYTGKVMKVTGRNLFADAAKMCRAEDDFYNGAALPVLEDQRENIWTRLECATGKI